MQKDIAHEGKEVLFEDVKKKVEDLKVDLDGDSEFQEDTGQRLVDEIESLCMNCQENGTTRLLLTRIPFFREIILMSFSCPHCNFQNAEVQSAGQIQELGSRFDFTLTESSDLMRQVVKSDTCTVRFVELDLEIPAGRGQLTTIEGLLTTVVEDLELNQPARKSLDPEAHAKIEEIITGGREMVAGSRFPFTVELDDPAGNSWIEPSTHDVGTTKLKRLQYKRTPEQNEALALTTDDSGKSADAPQLAPAKEANDMQKDDQKHESEIVPDEVYSFPASCPGCTKPCTTNMKMVNIPHFKEVVVMSTICDHCGYRTNEVKTGGAIPPKGRRIHLRVLRPEDLSRDILKSESCALSSPELNLSVTPGTLGGRFTTVEGLLTQVRDDLRSQIFDVGEGVDSPAGDSLPAEEKKSWDDFFGGLDRAIKADMEYTLVLEDPMAASYVQNLCAPAPDPQIAAEDYERTEEENEDLGLNDMKVEEYGADEAGAGQGEVRQDQANERSDHDT